MPYFIQIDTYPNTKYLFDESLFTGRNIICIELNDTNIEILNKLNKEKNGYDSLYDKNDWRKNKNEKLNTELCDLFE